MWKCLALPHCRPAGAVGPSHYRGGHELDLGHAVSARIDFGIGPDVYDAKHASSTGLSQLQVLIAEALGNFEVGGFVTGGTVAASGAPTDTLTEADLSSFGAGEPICWATGNAGLPYYVGWITDNNAAPVPDEITLLQTTPPYDPQGTELWGGAPTIWQATTSRMDPYRNNGSNGGVSGGPTAGTLTDPATSWTFDMLGHEASDKRQ